jgi:hypothetical protein
MELEMLELEAMMLLPFMWWVKLVRAHHEFVDELFAGTGLYQ